MPPRLTFHRTKNDDATDVDYLRHDGQYAAVRIADHADAETIAGQLRVLADMLTRPRDDGQGRASVRGSRRRAHPDLPHVGQTQSLRCWPCIWPQTGHAQWL